MTDDQYAVVQAKAQYEKQNPMADDDDEDHLWSAYIDLKPLHDYYIFKI